MPPLTNNSWNTNSSISQHGCYTFCASTEKNIVKYSEKQLHRFQNCTILYFLAQLILAEYSFPIILLFYPHRIQGGRSLGRKKVNFQQMRLTPSVPSSSLSIRSLNAFALSRIPFDGWSSSADCNENGQIAYNLGILLSFGKFLIM